MATSRTPNTNVQRAGDVTTITFVGSLEELNEGLYMGEERFVIDHKAQKTSISFCSADVSSVERIALLFRLTPAETASMLVLDDGDVRDFYLPSTKRGNALDGLRASARTRKMLTGMADFRHADVV